MEIHLNLVECEDAHDIPPEPRSAWSDHHTYLTPPFIPAYAERSLDYDIHSFHRILESHMSEAMNAGKQRINRV